MTVEPKSVQTIHHRTRLEAMGRKPSILSCWETPSWVIFGAIPLRSRGGQAEVPPPAFNSAVRSSGTSVLLPGRPQTPAHKNGLGDIPSKWIVLGKHYA